MEKEKLISEFKKFLFENDAYARFVFNISNPHLNGHRYNHKQLGDYLNNRTADGYILWAFLFDRAPEGVKYWQSVNEKWLEHLESLNKPKSKPPIGLRPRFISDMERINEIGSATYLYINAGIKIPQEWIDEYNELAERYLSH